MKVALAYALVALGSLTTTSAEFSTSNASVVDTNVASATNSSRELRGPICSAGPNAVVKWYYNSRSDGPYKCTKKYGKTMWGMWKAYRTGGTQNVHWKYTNDVNDPECLTKWTLYTSDGKTALESNIARTTTNGGTKRWCALPVYRPGGVLGKQWGYCSCIW